MSRKRRLKAVYRLAGVAALITAATGPFARAAAPTAPVAATVPAAAPRQSPSLPVAKLPVEVFTLSNGLRVLLHEDHRTPQVAVNVWYHAGFADDPPGKRGLAHLFEHLMLRGSKHVGRDRYLGLMEQVGASERNATTSLDRTNYMETIPSSELALALWIESDRMSFFTDVVDSAMLEKEKVVVKNEYRTGMLERPFSFVPRFARNALYPSGHPYHWRIEHEMDDSDSVTLDDLRSFYRKHYGPSGATLSIAGDIDPAKAKALVTKYFGTLPASAAVRTDASSPASTQTETIILAESGSEFPRLTMAWAGPPRFSEGDGQLALAADLLGRFGGRLHSALVRGDGIASAISASQDEMSTRRGRIFWLRVDLKKGIDPRRAQVIVDHELDRLRTEGPSADEVAEARRRWASSQLWGIESVTRRADLLNEVDRIGGDPSAFERIQVWNAASNQASVRDAVQKWLSRERRAVVIVEHTRRERPFRRASQARRRRREISMSTLRDRRGARFERVRGSCAIAPRHREERASTAGRASRHHVG